jgi:GcrA cell cycle regulator
VIARQLGQRRAARLARPKIPRTWRSKRPRLNIFVQHEMLMAAFRRPQPPAEDIPIYNGRGCTLLELSQGKCRWPISNPGAEDFCFCGNEPVKGLPYCLGHARIAYRSVGRRRSSAGA